MDATHALGEQVGRWRTISSVGLAVTDTAPAMTASAAAAQTCLPDHLVEAVDDYCARYFKNGETFTHSGLMYRHVLTDGDRLTGVIDWGDATAAAPTYELAKLHLDLLKAQPALLRAFLNGAGWRLPADYPYDALAQAFVRQAVGLKQHGRMDVFHRLPHRWALDTIGGLEELAERVFAV